MMQPVLQQASRRDAGRIAALLAADLPWGWSPAGVTGLIDDLSGFGLCLWQSDRLVAAALFRTAADEAEVLALAVAAEARRQGHGGRLLAAGLEAAHQRGAVTAFLEVEIDNLAARHLYRRAGFVDCGRRLGYYSGESGPRDAAVMRCDLMDHRAGHP